MNQNPPDNTTKPRSVDQQQACSVAWIVIGETGEYSDYSEWNVAGFTTEALAEEFRQLCQSEADKVNGSKDHKLRSGFKHAYDTQFYCDYTGTKYRVEMVEVFNVCPPNDKNQAP